MKYNIILPSKIDTIAKIKNLNVKFKWLINFSLLNFENKKLNILRQ